MKLHCVKCEAPGRGELQPMRSEAARGHDGPSAPLATPPHSSSSAATVWQAGRAEGEAQARAAGGRLAHRRRDEPQSAQRPTEPDVSVVSVSSAVPSCSDWQAARRPKQRRAALRARPPASPPPSHTRPPATLGRVRPTPGRLLDFSYPSAWSINLVGARPRAIGRAAARRRRRRNGCNREWTLRRGAKRDCSSTATPPSERVQSWWAVRCALACLAPSIMVDICRARGIRAEDGLEMKKRLSVGRKGTTGSVQRGPHP